MERTKWKLRPDVFISNVFVLLYRDEHDDGPEKIEIDYELSFLGTDGLPLISRTGTHIFLKGRHSGLQNFATKDEIFSSRRTEFLPRDVLTIRCRMWKKGIETPKPDVCFARTRLGLDRHCFVWAIKDFSSLHSGHERRRVLESTSEGSPQPVLIFCLRQFDGKEYICIDIDKGDVTKIPSVIGEIALLDAEGTAVYSEKVCKYILKGQMKLFRNFYETQILLYDKTTLLPNDVLFLRCEIEILYDTVSSRIENSSECESAINTDLEDTHVEESDKSATASCPFKQNVHKFFEDGTLSDIILRADAKTYPAHKIILSSRSPVFKAMFTNDMKEKASRCINVPDVDAATMQRLLFYIYTNEVAEVPWEQTADLLRAADKYGLLELKRQCSTFLKSNISRTNVCVLLSLADMLQDEELHKAVLDFIAKNANIFNSQTWKLFKKEKSELAMETMERIVYNVANSDRRT
ncbi:TD and POZ domain-containing protein 3 [Argiope bruennichi]|uniref:TD and POZ domain-containing protein 3 n=1 Tax=Argiope bruennichi TaxID=94029 RepID=A0A8T0EDT0_ARGBR|nr:TD and POZ domain-containing protein 3 [Argiope bruennichi]